jgi:hypothetical protein
VILGIGMILDTMTGTEQNIECYICGALKAFLYLISQMLLNPSYKDCG